METRKIVLEKEIRIPDTDIILEAGDELIIHEEAIIDESELKERISSISDVEIGDIVTDGIDYGEVKTIPGGYAKYYAFLDHSMNISDKIKRSAILVQDFDYDHINESVKEALGSNFVGSYVYEGKVCQVYDNGNSYTFTWDGGLGKQELTKKEFDRLDIIDGRYTESIQFKIEESIQKKEAVDIYALHRRDKGDINKARFFKTYPSSLDFFNHMRRLGYSRIDMGMPEVLGSDTAYEKPDTGERLFIYSTYNESINEAVDIKKIIKDLQGDFGGNNESQMKGVQLLKGLATSEDPLSNKFMKALNTAMTKISKNVLGDKEESIKEGEGRLYLTYNDGGMISAKYFNSDREAYAYVKQIGTDKWALFRNEPHFHSTADPEYLVAFGAGDYFWIAQAKKDPEIAKKLYNEASRKQVKPPHDFGNGISLLSYGMSGNGNHTVTVETPRGKKSIQTNQGEYLQGDFGGDNESQMKGVQLIKGLATSDDPLSNKFMKALNTAMTTISKEVLGEGKKESKQRVSESTREYSEMIKQGITGYIKKT